MFNNNFNLQTDSTSRIRFALRQSKSWVVFMMLIYTSLLLGVSCGTYEQDSEIAEVGPSVVEADTKQSDNNSKKLKSNLKEYFSNHWNHLYSDVDEKVISKLVGQWESMPEWAKTTTKVVITVVGVSVSAYLGARFTKQQIMRSFATKVNKMSDPKLESKLSEKFLRDFSQIPKGTKRIVFLTGGFTTDRASHTRKVKTLRKTQKRKLNDTAYFFEDTYFIPVPMDYLNISSEIQTGEGGKQIVKGLFKNGLKPELSQDTKNLSYQIEYVKRHFPDAELFNINYSGGGLMLGPDAVFANKANVRVINVGSPYLFWNNQKRVTIMADTDMLKGVTGEAGSFPVKNAIQVDEVKRHEEYFETDQVLRLIDWLLKSDSWDGSKPISKKIVDSVSSIKREKYDPFGNFSKVRDHHYRGVNTTSLKDSVRSEMKSKVRQLEKKWKKSKDYQQFLELKKKLKKNPSDKIIAKKLEQKTRKIEEKMGNQFFNILRYYHFRHGKPLDSMNRLLMKI